MSNASSLLKSTERIEEVVFAQATNPWWALLTYLVAMLSNAYRVVVVTDRRILVCQGGRYLRSTVKGVLRELPRETKIGSPRGLWFRTDALGERLWIPFQFFKDVKRADGAA